MEEKISLPIPFIGFTKKLIEWFLGHITEFKFYVQCTAYEKPANK